jgi:signal transduction histidine kinase
VKSKNVVRGYEHISRIIAILTISVGVLVVCGWLFDIDELKSVLPNTVTMKFNAAILFIVAGVSLYFVTRIREGDLTKSHTVLLITIMIVFTFMASTVLSIFINVDTGINTVFIEEKSAILTVTPGQPSLGTIACFIIQIPIWISALYSSRLFTRLSPVLGLSILVLGSVGIVGYVVGQPVLYYSVEDTSTAMALATAVLFVLLGCAFILLGKTKEIELTQLKRAALNKKLLSALLAASIIPLIITTLVIYTTVQQQIQLESQKILESSSINIANALDVNSSLRKQQIEILATRNLIQNLLTAYDKKNSGLTIDEHDVQITREELKIDMEEFMLATGYELSKNVTRGYYQIDLVTKNGLLVFSTDISVEGTDLSSSQIVKKAISGSDFWYELDNRLKIPSTVIVSPVLDKEKFEIVGAIIARKSTDTAFEILTHGNVLGDTLQSYLVNNEKLMITPSRFMEDAPYNLRVDTEPITKCFEHGENFKGYYQDYRGVQVFGVSECNILPGFVLITELDKSEILNPLTTIKNFSILLILVLICLIAALGIIISRSITIPITKLVQVVQRIGDGDLKARAEEIGDQEIVEVSTTVNQMAYSLKKSNDTILQSKEIIEQQLEDLRNNDVQKDEFASMVTHELKTPLTPIKGRCEMLLEPGVLGHLTPTQEESVRIIYNSSTRLERLISDVLDAQKIDMKRIKFNIGKINVTQFMEDITNDSLQLTNEKEIAFLNTTASNISLMSDDARLTQVMVNLIRNAVDFVQPKTGVIEIGATDNNDNVVFHVKDNGIGIPKDQHSNLFKKFFQIDTSARRKHGGTGLGLVICKGIVEALGGKIWFESDEGKGAAFFFYIPKEVKD